MFRQNSIPKNNFLLLIAFISGLTIMAMEISAARLFAPYFGTSIFVWTNIIGVVLAALSLGYYIGGRLADSKPRLNILLGLILAAGIIFLIVPWIAEPLASWLTPRTIVLESASVVIFTSSLVLTLILFGFPLMILGAVSPFIIKLYSLSRSQIGEIAGSVFAISTIGSILGTFLPTLWLIPILGTKTTISIFAALLIIVAGSGLLIRKAFIFLLLALILPIRYVDASHLGHASGLLFEDESAYQYIQVRQSASGNRYLIFDEGIGVQSVYNARSILTGGYYDYFNMLPPLVNSPRKKQALILGLAGGTISRQLDYFFRGDLEIDGVEIDKEVIEVAEKYFGLRNPSLAVYNQEGRMFLKSASKTYDIIIVDAYARELYIPWTLTTREFWKLVDAKLTPEGIVAININSPPNNPALLQAITNTMASVFKYSYITKTGGGESFNYMVTASQSPPPFKRLPELVDDFQLLKLAEEVAANTADYQYNPASPVLTDDRAPVEYMTATMLYAPLPKSLK